MNKDQIESEVKIIQNLFFTNNYNTIISLSKKGIKKYPKISIFYNLLGLALSNLGRFENAEIVLLRGHKVNPNDLAIINNLANVHKSRHNFTEAENLFNKSIKLKKDYVNAYVNYGHLKKDLNKFNDSIKLYKKALEYDKKIPAIYYSLAMSYQALGNFKDSDNYAQKTLEIEPEFTKADLLISRSKKYIKNDPHLLKMISKLENLNLNDSLKIELFFAISKAYEDLNDMENSMKYLAGGNLLKRKRVKFDINKEKKIFENIKEIFSKFDYKSLVKQSDNNKKIIFILGMPRSGTTLVEQIISSHSEVYSSGELPYLSLIINQRLTKDRDFLMNEVNSFLNNNDNLLELSQKYFSYIDHYEIDQKIITDKAPLNFMWVGFIKMIFPGAKIIHCIRDPKENCISMYKNVFEGGLDFCYSENELGLYYKLYKDLMDFWSKKFPGTFYNVNYENLVQNQSSEIKSIIKYCELKWQEKCLKFSENKSPIKTASVAQARSPIYKTSLNNSKKFEPYLKNLFDLL